MDAQKVALVTGSSRGIGRAIALRLADEADAVIVHYHHNRDEAENVAEAIRKKGKGSASYQADLTNEKEAVALIKKAEEQFGRIDILVNNIGPWLTKPWIEVTGEEWLSVIEGILLSAFYCLKAVLPGMRQRKWGRIINIGYSRAEQLAAFPTIAPYAIAKTGLLILTRTAASSEVGYGITVNMVSPGLIEGGAMPAKNIPEASIGKFEDVAEAAAFLTSEKAARITGTNLIVAGTWKM